MSRVSIGDARDQGPSRGARGRSAPARLEPEDGDPALADVIDALLEADARFPSDARSAYPRRPKPSRDAIAAVLDGLRAVLFPTHFNAEPFAQEKARYGLGVRLDRIERELAQQIWRGLAVTCGHPGDRATCDACAESARRAARALLKRLPAIRTLLDSDLRAALEGDPSATLLDETLLCYPGVAAIIHHRIGHELQRLGVPLIPRMIADLSRASIGIDIHPAAHIGASFFIDHGTGVVIGETCIIGARVRIYQGVTLGARGFPADLRGLPIKGLPRHPIVQDDVIIYAGATILGRIQIGKGAVIGGNVWVTRDVAPGARLTQVQPLLTAFEGGAGI